MKLIPRDLNPNPYLPHPTSTYTCRVTIASRVCDGGALHYYNMFCILPCHIWTKMDECTKVDQVDQN